MSRSPDAYLVRLAEAAEAEADCHYVRLLVGPAVIVGKPCSYDYFVRAMIQPMKDETWELTGKDYGTGVKSKAEREQKFEEKVGVRSEMLRSGVDGPDPSALHLRQVRWLPSNGDGLNLPALRVALESVDGWWVAGGDAISSRGGGSFFVGGGIFSLGD